MGFWGKLSMDIDFKFDFYIIVKIWGFLRYINLIYKRLYKVM